MKPVDILSRDFLQSLRDTSKDMASVTLNPHWVRAYLNLADAADRLDAMTARCEATDYSVKEPLSEKSECTAPDCDCDEQSGCQRK